MEDMEFQATVYLRKEEVKYESRLKPSKIFTMDIIQWYPV